MTVKELNSVRELNKQIRELERHLVALRISVENITPILDGLPHSTDVKSRVEKLALDIVDDEKQLATLREQLPHVKINLVNLIMREADNPTLQTLLILRYVACCSFKETARRMKFTLRHVYRIHEKFFKMSPACTLAAKMES